MVLERSNTKENTKFEASKYMGWPFQVVDDKNFRNTRAIRFFELIELLKTYPVTRKKITCQEYEIYKDYRKYNFDEYDAEASYYLAGGYRVALELEFYNNHTNEKEVRYYNPNIEEAMPFYDFPNEYIETLSPDYEMLIILFMRLNQAWKDNNGENGQGYVLSVKDWGMRENEGSSMYKALIEYDLDGFSWERVTD